MEEYQFITLYSPKKLIDYKQDEEFLSYLAYRDGLLSQSSSALYYILHTDKNIGCRREVFEGGKIVREYVYIPLTYRLCKYYYSLRRVNKEIKGNKVLIINNTFRQVLAHKIAKSMGWSSVKIVGTFFYHQRRSWKKRIVEYMEDKHFKHADKIVIISHSGFKYVPKKYLNKMMYKIPQFMFDVPDTKIVPRKKFRYSAICLSRLESEKGLKELIKAWKNIDHKWTLKIFGDGSMRNELEQLIIDCGLTQRVTIELPISHSRIWDKLWHHDVFVMTSPSEGLGLAYLEALYMKVPCIGLKVDGVRDTLGNDRGIMINKDKLNEKLGEALDAARRLRSEKDWQQYIDDFFEKSIHPHINYSLAEHL